MMNCASQCIVGTSVERSTAPQFCGTRKTATTYAKSESASSLRILEYAAYGAKSCSTAEPIASTRSHTSAGPPASSRTESAITPRSAARFTMFATVKSDTAPQSTHFG